MIGRKQKEIFKESKKKVPIQDISNQEKPEKRGRKEFPCDLCDILRNAKYHHPLNQQDVAQNLIFGDKNSLLDTLKLIFLLNYK
ncbi:unnamed protein product [Rhizophagus irregularis]|nr:unnamed protein product [Rhizophagus irregularis]